METIVAVLSFFTILVLLSVFILMMYAMVFGAPFAALAENRITTMLRLLKLKKGDKMADLGSGDGRIVIAFARQGIEAHGFEINPILVVWSRLRIKKLGLQNKAFVHFKSYWSQDFSGYDAVAVYGISHMMGRLERKLLKEMKQGGKIVSNYFKLPSLKPVKEENKVLLYTITKLSSSR